VVKTLDVYQGLVVIESGLNEGQYVIVKDVQLARPGQLVKTEESALENFIRPGSVSTAPDPMDSPLMRIRGESQDGSNPPPGQRFEFPVTAKWRLSMVPEFEEIIVRARSDGSKVFLRDVARVELGSETYEQSGYLSGKSAATVPIYQYSNANALSIVQQVRQEMDRLSRDFPPDVEYRIALDTTWYVKENIDEVEHTLVEAFILVLIVVFVFLQGLRTSLIPMVTIPVSLIATFGLMAAFGFSINTRTLMGLVLAIGLVVDDAIIVVENVEKYLERGAPWRSSSRPRRSRGWVRRADSSS
jgi:multidrug efflux pump subunit AcrB